MHLFVVYNYLYTQLPHHTYIRKIIINCNKNCKHLRRHWIEALSTAASNVNNESTDGIRSTSSIIVDSLVFLAQHHDVKILIGIIDRKKNIINKQMNPVSIFIA